VATGLIQFSPLLLPMVVVVVGLTLMSQLEIMAVLVVAVV
jgi:hypothetical protein